MAKYNPNLLSQPLTGAFGTQFGVPSCLFELGLDVLGLLPGNVLGSISNGMTEGMGAARSALSNVNHSIFRDLGIMEYDAATGKLVFLSDTSRYGMDAGAFGALSELGNFLGQVVGFGTALWQNYQVIQEQIDEIQSCLGSLESSMEAQQGKTDITDPSVLAVTPQKLEIYKSQVKIATDFINSALELQSRIDEVIADREADPSLVPVFEGDEGPIEDPLFRLDFGPPSAKQGQFLLSVDGLYYDSQSRYYGTSASPTDVPTLVDVSAQEFVPDASRWLLDHAPNLGGRGGSYTIADLNDYVDTIFDLDHIDNTRDMQEFYDADHLVEFLISQKNKRITDIQNNLVDLRVSGYSTDSAIYINFEKQISSENAAFNDKINKRKKQIEAAVKAPDLFGIPDAFTKGDIPINDFSYLSSINLDIEISKQQNISFDHGEVSGIILPIVPKYVRAIESSQKTVVTPLLVSTPGAGSIIDGEELETEAPLLSLVTGISTDKLIAVYNFTDVNLEIPSSDNYRTLNCNAHGTENRAQTVTVSPSVMFQKGLGVPYLTGIPVRSKTDSDNEKGETWDTHGFKIDSVGNYIKLPDSEEYQNLMYTTEGTTIDFWTYVPGLYKQESGWWEHPFETSSFGFTLSSSTGKWCDGHYYRVLLGCENTGGKNTELDQSALTLDHSLDFVKGMVMGFSRDPRMYYEGSAVTPGTTDFDVRQSFGAVLDSLSPEVNDTDHPYSADDTGIWTVSSNPAVSLSLPIAFTQASGTFSVNSSGKISYSIGSDMSSGDGYTSSSHGTDFWLYTASGPSFDTPYGLSAEAAINYFATGEDKTLNMGTPSSVFFIAPTRSYNTSSVGFAKSLECNNEVGEILKFVVSDELTSGGVKLKDCASKFMHISVVFNAPEDTIDFYLNGNLLKSSPMQSVFEQGPKTPPSVPSFMVPSNLSTSSFHYTSATVDQYSDVNYFDNGPKNHKYFTPWVVGGGWSDGQDINLSTSSGGFLDTGAGIMSSYNGYVGSLKVYQKALNKNEVIKNYNHQKKFFENIEL